MSKKHLISWLLKKAVSMALWAKASLCGKSSLLEQSLPRTPSQLISLCPLWLLSLFRSLSAVALAKADAFVAKILCACPPRRLAGNPWLINDLHAFGIFTLVEKSLQIRLFMQNKANFRKVKLNVNKVLTKDYDKKTLGERGKTKPIQSQLKPIQSQFKANFKKAKMNVTSILTVGYENKPPIRAPKKQSQISKQQKPMQTSLPKVIMKKTAQFLSRCL